MSEHEGLAERFEAFRPHLRTVAHRMLGSRGDADDAVQEAWLRLAHADRGEVRNLGGYLTTVVARVCLDMLRARRSRREEPFAAETPEPVVGRGDAFDAERELAMADAVGVALLVVLETLTPAERVAFVLHDLFDLPFDEVAPVVGRSPAAARQLASRARRRVRGAGTASAPDRARQREVVEAFLAAARSADFDALLAVLDPDVEVRADAAAVRLGAARVLRGAQAVAERFKGQASGARPAVVEGMPGLVWAPGGRPKVAFVFTTLRGKVVGIDLVADPERVARVDLDVSQG